MKTPNKISVLILEGTCSIFPAWEVDKKYEKATRANKRVINQLVKRKLPELYSMLALDLRNPYHYYKTKTHLILVHSATDYFLTYELL